MAPPGLGSITAMVAAAALAGAQFACGGDGASATTQDLAAPIGKPLPPELVGSWYERTKGDDTTWRTSFLAAGHKLCLKVVETRGDCFFGEAAEGGAVLEADDLGQPRLTGYGEVGVSGDELVFRVGDSPDEECDGTRHTADWTLRGKQLILEQTSPGCGPTGTGTIRLDRAG